MKKIGITITLFLMMFIFSSSVTLNVNNNNKAKESKNSLNASNIKFEYFYRGFATVKENMVDKYPVGTFIIQTDDDWHDFMNKYVPGIPYYLTVNYSKDYLVINSLNSPKPTYCVGVDIKTFIINGNELEPVYKSGAIGISDGIYAQNIDNAEHFFINIVKINKKYIPRNIKNLYHR
jgi:hypothetical protein